MARNNSHSEVLPTSAAAPDGSSAVTMPSGPAVAAEAFAWLNRQVSWQALLQDLEFLSRCTNHR
jgi:hypothetical protein